MLLAQLHHSYRYHTEQVYDYFKALQAPRAGLHNVNSIGIFVIGVIDIKLSKYRDLTINLQ